MGCCKKGLRRYSEDNILELKIKKFQKQEGSAMTAQQLWDLFTHADGPAVPFEA